MRAKVDWGNFNHTTHEIIRQVTECDRALYLDVIWRHAELSSSVECQLPALYEAVNTRRPVGVAPPQAAGRETGRMG